VKAGNKYHFLAVLHTSLAPVGGEQHAVGGTATVNSVNYTIVAFSSAGSIPILTQATALSTPGGNGGYSFSLVLIFGTMDVATDGDVMPEFALSSPSGTSTVLAGSTFAVLPVE
jgi:hypothetical protein